MFQSLKILIIDDEPNDCLLLSSNLRSKFEGLQVVVASTEKELESACRSGRFDMVITDYDLPWTTGLHVLEVIRRAWGDCPVIMYTGAGSERIAVEAMKAGFKDYLVKSTANLSELLDSISLHIEHLAHRRALHESQRRYEDLFEGVPIGLFRCLPDGQFTSTNKAFVSMLGYRDSEEFKSVALELLYPNPGDRQRWQAQAEEHEHASFEFPLRRRNGRLIWGRIRAKAIRDEGGNVVAFEGSFTDITEQHEARETLRQSEARYSALVESTPEGVLIADRRTLGLLYVNPTLCRLFGYNRNELLQLQLPDLHPKNQLKFLVDIASGTSFSESTVHEEFSCLRKDKAEAYAEVQVHTETLDGRDLVFVYYRDVTDRRFQERKLREMGETLPTLATSANFWSRLVESGSKVFDGETFFVARVAGTGAQEFQVLARAGDERFSATNPLPHENEPWPDLFRRRFLGSARGVRKDYPKSKMLALLQAEALIALPLNEESGKIIGMVGVISKKPLRKMKLSKAFLQIYAALAVQKLQGSSPALGFPSPSNIQRTPQSDPSIIPQP